MAPPGIRRDWLELPVSWYWAPTVCQDADRAPASIWSRSTEAKAPTVVDVSATTSTAATLPSRAARRTPRTPIRPRRRATRRARKPRIERQEADRDDPGRETDERRRQGEEGIGAAARGRPRRAGRASRPPGRRSSDRAGGRRRRRRGRRPGPRRRAGPNRAGAGVAVVRRDRSPDSGGWPGR